MNTRTCKICADKFTPARTRSIMGPSPYCLKCNRAAHYRAWGTRTAAHPVGVGGMVNGN